MRRGILPFLMVGALATGVTQGAEVTRSRFLMGTRCTGTILTPDDGGDEAETRAAVLLEEAFGAIARIEGILSDWRDDTEMSRLNHESTTGPFACSPEMFDFLDHALAAGRDTRGAFDITVGPLVEAWDLRGQGRLATDAEIESALARVGSAKVLLSPDGSAVSFAVPGMRLDPGAIGKGYALDAAARVLRAGGVTTALIDFGGQLIALGAPPGETGWEIDVAHPEDRGHAAATIRIRDASVATSGNSERGIVVEGRTLGHVIDPRTGRPVTTRGSVTVVAPTGTRADATATALLVMGPDEGKRWLDSHPDVRGLWLAPGEGGTLDRVMSPGFPLAGEEPETPKHDPSLRHAGGNAAAAAVGAGVESAASPGSDAERIARLEARVATLEAELAEARGGSAGKGDAPGAAELERRIDLLAEELAQARMGAAGAPTELRSRHGLGPGASKVYEGGDGISIGGYGEALLTDYDARSEDGERSGSQTEADLLRAILYFGYKYNDTIVFNSEIEYEHASTEDAGEVSVEFATLDFLLNDAASIRTGLVLVPVGFINEIHEPPSFLGARRPDVEHDILPTTWRELGVGVFGEAGPFSYRAYVVNGLDAMGFTGAEGIREGRQAGSEATARDLAFTARADYEGVPGLVVGASYYAGDSGQGLEDPATGDVVDAHVTLVEGHAEFRFRGVELRGLWSRVDIDDTDVLNVVTGETIGSRLGGWYVQAGYDVLSPMGERTRQGVIPYARYERYDTQDEVATGFSASGANDVRILTYGVAWKPHPEIAIKVDYQDIDRADDSGTNQFNAAIGYVF